MTAPKYSIKIVRRDGQGQVNDDYHATVTRLIDGVTHIYISRWRWVLNRKLRRKAIDADFAWTDRRRIQLGEIEVREI